MASTMASRLATSIEFPAADESSLKTPTRHSFAGIAGQKPLPSLPQPPSSIESQQITLPSRHHEDARKSEDDGSDIDMEDAKSPKGSEDSVDGADGDGVEGADGKSSKKKRGQRFFCSDFPPCNLSFTRSEHLARHIRKHTGERPFQCHCGRRFSRLDNLRQHAQTVHVNEDIPMDSLAANGTRFQRQIRTERARPTGRSRSSTFTSGVPPPHLAHMHRGHSRNLSSSSIASMTSVSTLGGDDYRRAPLGFETPRSNRLSLDTYVTSSPIAPTTQPYYSAGVDSPAGYSTPGAFSHGNSSPRFSSSIHSPMTNNTSRSSFWTGHKPPHRRLSASSSTPFQSAHSPDLQSSAQHSPVPSHAALQRHSHYTPSPGPSGLDSPRDSPSTPVDSEYRRHTWQPQINTQLRRPRVEPNILTTSQITDLPRPRAVFPSLEQPVQNVTRLPGIHTFDQPPPPSTLLGARAPSPMHVDGPPTSHPAPQSQHAHATSHQRGVSWTASLQKDFHRMDLANEQRPTSWAATGRPSVPESPVVVSPARGHSRHISDSSVTSAPSSTPTARKNKRMGWYIQPPTAQQAPNPERPSPDSSDGAPTPITSSLGFQPAIVNQANGHIEPQGLGLSHVDEPTKATLIAAPSPYHQPVRSEQRSSLPPRAHDRYSNPFGLSRVHEHGPAEHFNHTSPSHHPPQYGPVSLPEDRRGLDALVAAATSDRH